MLWVPALRLLVLHVAILLLAVPVGRATAPQPASAAPSAVKATLPVGALPITVAVKVTLAPRLDGLAEEVSAVVDDALLAVHASTSVMRDQVLSALVMLMRIRSVVYGEKFTVRLTRLLPLTVPSATQLAPSQPCTVKSVTP